MTVLLGNLVTFDYINGIISKEILPATRLSLTSLSPHLTSSFTQVDNQSKDDHNHNGDRYHNINN